ncbi:thiamine pyrophosphate-dependent enzyme [Candidatus Parcubacteria bacterium]|nr:thiamine pyrophosphate-dependent enzyme [Candidatus Parcubacteria bacterium]
MNLIELSKKSSRLAPGHSTCTGCGIPIIVRTVLRAIDRPVIIVNATSCLEVTTTVWPQTAWEVPYIHSAFENAAATASGVEAALAYLKRINRPVKSEPIIVAFAGDGGTYDIGLQSLSGALERGHNFLYICYDNEAYMNTGIQRSSATPHAARTTTSQAGSVQHGKIQWKKPLTEIVTAHGIPYVAQASISHLLDLVNKVQKAISYDGPKFINVLQPCTLGWGFEPAETIAVARLAVETRLWPLYEVAEGEWTLTVPVPELVPISEYLKGQTRFAHLFKPGGERVIKEIQQRIDQNWKRLIKQCPVK